MTILYFVFAGLVASILVSYFGVVIKRGFKKSLVSLSSCDYCKKELSWFNKLPIISALKIYFFNSGKTECCRKRLPSTYLVTELYGFLIGGLVSISIQNFLEINPLFISGNLQFSVFSALFFWLVICAIFLFISVDDLWNYQIDLYLVVFLALAILVGSILYTEQLSSLMNNNVLGLNSLIAALVAASVVIALILITKGKGLGVGDIFIVAVVALSLGPLQSLFSFQITIYTAAVAGIVYSLLKRKYKGLIVPLVPFLMLGWLLVVTFPETFLLLWEKISYI